MENRRIATWWITWEDLNWPDIDNMKKLKERAEGLAKANVNTVMLFGAHFRWDWMPFFPLLHNYIATVTDELHKYGIKVFDHHSVNLVHRYDTQEEVLHVMKDSGPHLPLSPTREAAASWQYKGKYLNDWRMMDVKTDKPLYLPQYTAEGFCHRNSEFKEAYRDYFKYLIKETGIDGLSADDAMYYAGFNACSCRYCKAEFKKRTGKDLPSTTDLDFWGNWDNPDWHHWIDLRFDATGDFYRELGEIIPEGFVLTGCGGSSAGAVAPSATDARQFMKGCNYINMELSGNTPPYKHDPKTANESFGNRLASGSHHQAVAREHGTRTFSNTYTHTIQSTNIAWALCKFMDSDAWLGTLKARLGLPRHILNTLPEEKDIVIEAFTYEKEHPQLFNGDSIGQVGVYFSYETRNHTMSGTLLKGYAMDFKNALSLLSHNSINPHTVFDFPDNADTYPLILLSGVSRMTAKEIQAAQKYLDAGGKIIAVGPTAMTGCKYTREMPNRTNLPIEDFVSYVPPGDSWIKLADWVLNWELPKGNDPDEWQHPQEGLYYHPQRICEESNNAKLLELCKQFMRPVPIKVDSAKGFLCSFYETKDTVIAHFLAEDYDVEIDQELDSIRFHRSRVNLITNAEPIGTDGVIKLESEHTPTVYTPFDKSGATVVQNGNRYTVKLPEKCFYAILTFDK